MKRRPLVLSAAAAALVAGAAVTAPAQAAPPTPEADYAAPYEGFARFGSSSSCTTGATCTATGSADASTGRGTSTTGFERALPAAGRESSFGYAVQGVTFKVPPSASSVTATFTWRIESSSVSASATKGLAQAYTGVAAYAFPCDGSCVSEPKAASVQYAGSVDGVPSTGGAATEAEKTVTVTATGKLPRFLRLQAYPYSVAAGDVSKVCLAEDDCTIVSEQHAGSASASITAVLTSVKVTTS